MHRVGVLQNRRNKSMVSAHGKKRFSFLPRSTNGFFFPVPSKTFSIDLIKSNWLTFFLSSLVRQYRCFVHQILQIGARKSGGSLGDQIQSNIFRQWLAFGMDIQYLFPLLDVRRVQKYSPVKSSHWSKAGSSTSSRLVAAMTITFSCDSKPSISTKI